MLKSLLMVCCLMCSCVQSAAFEMEAIRPSMASVDMRVTFRPLWGPSRCIGLRGKDIIMPETRKTSPAKTLYAAAFDEILAGYSFLPEVSSTLKINPMVWKHGVREFICKKREFFSQNLEECFLCIKRALQEKKGVFSAKAPYTKRELQAQDIAHSIYPEGKTRLWSVISVADMQKIHIEDVVFVTFCGYSEVLQGKLCPIVPSRQWAAPEESLLSCKAEAPSGSLQFVASYKTQGPSCADTASKRQVCHVQYEDYLRDEQPFIDQSLLMREAASSLADKGGSSQQPHKPFCVQLLVEPKVMDLIDPLCISAYNVGVVWFSEAGRRFAGLFSCIDNFIPIHYNTPHNFCRGRTLLRVALAREFMKGFLLKDPTCCSVKDVRGLNHPEVREICCQKVCFTSGILEHFLWNYIPEHWQDEGFRFQSQTGFWCELDKSHLEGLRARRVGFVWSVINRAELQDIVNGVDRVCNTVVLLVYGEPVALCGKYGPLTHDIPYQGTLWEYAIEEMIEEGKPEKRQRGAPSVCHGTKERPRCVEQRASVYRKKMQQKQSFSEDL